MGKRFYPKNRKKKRKHIQYMDYDRVIKKWQFTPDMYYIFKIDNVWYACLPDAHFIGNIIADGEYFRPVHKIDHYNGNNGDAVYGYVGVIYSTNLSMYITRFVFMKNPMNIGSELSYILSFTRRDSFPNYIKNEIWKQKD